MTETAETFTFLPDILEEHLEELQMMLPVRHAAVRDGDAWRTHLVATDDRLLGHLDGVVAVGNPGLRWIAPFLLGEDAAGVQAGALACQALGTSESISMLTAAWDADEPVRIPAIGASLRLRPHPAVVAHLYETRGHGSALRRVVGERALVAHGSARADAALMQPFLRDPDAAVRANAWQLAAESEVVLPPRDYAAALRDDDAMVRESALLCAAWTGVQGALAMARQSAREPKAGDPLPLRLLALLGEASDRAAIAALVSNESLGVLRLELAGLHGAPAFVDLLIEAMAPDDPRRAIAAGRAFTRVTGVNVDSPTRVSMPRDDVDPDDSFANEFQDEGLLPDAGKARAAWDPLRHATEGCTRLCWGRRADAPFADDALADADLETAWWQLVRSRFWRVSARSLARVEAFPAR